VAAQGIPPSDAGLGEYSYSTEACQYLLPLAARGSGGVALTCMVLKTGEVMVPLTIVSICLLVIIVLSRVAVAQARALGVTRLSIAIPHWPGEADSVRIAHISDLHLPRLPVPLRRLRERGGRSSASVAGSDRSCFPCSWARRPR
jgi:hypothetical protein